jgi:polysaccharide export outer membrane protein
MQMTKTQRNFSTAAIVIAVTLAAFVPTSAQTAQTAPKQASSTAKPKPTPPPAPKPNYVIGVNDLLTVIVWRAPELSGDVRVRPDGKITLSAGNDIQASGLTTEELKASVIAEVKKCCYADPDVIIQSKEILSRIVYIQGEGIAKPGAYPLTGPMSIVQAVTIAGGFTEFAHKKEMMLLSGSLLNKDGSQVSWKINYDDIEHGRNLAKYNIQLSPGDTLIVK